MVQTRSKSLALEARKRVHLWASKTPKPPKPSNPPPEFSSPSSTSIIRVTDTSVYLNDWWLIKLHGKELGIAGFAYTRALGIKYFASAPISTRHCDTILETTDKIVIRISGLLNQQRTHQNGFPSSVCNKFMHGFPFNWEEYATRCLTGKDSAFEGASKRASMSDESNSFPGKVVNKKSSPSLDNVPMTTMRDVLMSTLGSSSYDLIIANIYNDILATSKKDSSKHPETPETNSTTPVLQKKAKSESNRRVNKDTVTTTPSRVTTRSMSRLETLGT